MECSTCMEDFSAEARVPKVLPCGHTACLQCLQQGQHQQCPTCRKVFTGAPADLPDNFSLLALMQRLGVALHPTPAAARPAAAAPDPPPAAARPAAAALDLPPAAAPPTREMDLQYLSPTAPGLRQKEKEAALQEAEGVVRMVRVYCDRDPAWSLQLLERAAPTIERLEVLHPREEHLRAVHAMPRLQRLDVSAGDGALDAQPPELGALPAGHGGLRLLRVASLPRATLQSLLQAHAGTLEELKLHAGTPGDREWPWSCADLDALLQQCGLRALRRLVLRRIFCSHNECEEQIAAVREALPGVQVLCGECDNAGR